LRKINVYYEENSEILQYFKEISRWGKMFIFGIKIKRDLQILKSCNILGIKYLMIKNILWKNKNILEEK
jgi:hypothetical protein